MNLIPLLFSTDMVRAKQAGRKQMTRRTRGLKNIDPRATEIVRSSQWPKQGDWVARFRYEGVEDRYEVTNIIKCPFGQPGDILWTRENWRFAGGGFVGKPDYSVMTPRDFIYQADEEWNGPWKPSIHMPYAACRSWDKLLEVRCERLRDISPEDACEEGIEYWNIDAEALEGGELVADYKNYAWKDDEKSRDHWFPVYANPVDSFLSLFASLNGWEAVDANPWVWVLKFEPTERPRILPKKQSHLTP